MQSLETELVVRPVKAQSKTRMKLRLLNLCFGSALQAAEHVPRAPNASAALVELLRELRRVQLQLLLPRQQCRHLSSVWNALRATGCEVVLQNFPRALWPRLLLPPQGPPGSNSASCRVGLASNLRLSTFFLASSCLLWCLCTLANPCSVSAHLTKLPVAQSAL